MSDLLRAMRRETVKRTPVWFMRQAGRYQQEYQAIRKKHAILDICRTADLATEVTLIPLKLMPELDAAILFSDLLVVLQPMGLKVDFVPGPVIGNPVRSGKDVESLRAVDPEESLGFVLDAIGQIRKEIKIPLIGFGGAPFTLASYVIEGGPSKNYLKTKGLMHSEPDIWNRLMGKLVDAVTALLRAQVKAGAQALQIFDSWAGALGPGDYREYVLPHSKRLLENLKDLGVPLVNFATNVNGMLELLKEAGGDVIGVDWRIPLDDAWKRLGDVAIQGNLDPAALFAPREVLLKQVDDVLAKAANRDGHIFNLGHGILPATPVDNVRAVLDHVHEKTQR